MRKNEIVKIVDDGKELTFRITQMPATKAERWVNRAAFLLVQASSGAKKNLKGNKPKKADDFDLEEIMRSLAGIDYDKVEPLYNELIECCEYLPSGDGMGIQCSQATIDAQIIEPLNLYRLRLAAAKLNFSFFINALQFQTQVKNTITFSKNTPR